MANIYTRRATLDDLDKIMEIINSAKQYLKESGSPQWQSGYPANNDIAKDIRAHSGYVLIVDGQVAGYSAMIIGDDPMYEVITEGSWANNRDPYATLHRVAISSQYRGQNLSSFLLSGLISLAMSQGVRNLRIDTFEKNVQIHRIAARFGFQKRGQILINDPLDPRRVAFELNIA